MKIGRRIYYEILTGNIIIDTGEKQGWDGMIETTIDQDIESYLELSRRTRNSFDVIELQYGQYDQDFASCNGYRVNPTTKQLEFTYPDPNAPQDPPVYQAPLSDQVKSLNDQLQTTQDAVDFLILNNGGI